ncbi:cytochrome c oxidase assembly protein [Alkalilimnicola sp. S0819]|uniref:cytochrome c oxidase assembly protein n=1 Tax=Alkalilimnicola sp. S0819 TaxID=2613922 RepID=UPI001261985C|nr:cytochrome c oxidase assembly protein [Alkalilimnicola sp. S0819]KAB7624435.1 cytochrome c oxidase assembly protein [Alkalilimnicola sp. S0819]MPQ16268.1 cytochrome c oxidase assembly protein [Alkalilimnicola sp. S0819]
MSGVTPENRRTLRKLALVAVLMFGFGFALVPLYDIFCEVTGFGGRAVQTGTGKMVQVDTDRLVTVEFVATVSNSGQWEFYPLESKMQVHPGEIYTTEYFAKNLRDTPQIGQASYNVAPSKVGRYFAKPDCFCFTQQRFVAAEGRNMPVTFFIDPQLPSDVNTVTLSYTFHTIDG